MNKYLCKADCYNPDAEETWTERRIMIAEDGWNALDHFIEWIWETYGSDIDIDNDAFSDLGPVNVFIEMTRESYGTDSCTLTVGELIKALQDFDTNSKVFIVDHSGMFDVFGGLREWRINEEEINED